MTWTLENSRNDESAKIRWELVPYMRGRVLDIGCGPYKAFPHFIGCDNGHHWGHMGTDVRVDSAEKLDLFADKSCDLVYSSHLLEHFEYSKVPSILQEWMRVVKLGGYLILYVPDEDQYPKVGHPHANPDHKWNVSYDKLVAAMERMDSGWDLSDYQVRSERDEYSLFFVFKKTEKGHEHGWKLPKPSKTAAVIRFGAIGDNVQASSILPWLKENGYWVDFFCQSGNGYEAVKHDPHVDRFIVLEKDMIPNQFLLEFFEDYKKKYTKFINLCESVEGTLLASPGRANWDWPNELRAKMCDHNYTEFLHELAEVPPPYRPKFYSTPKEREKAQWQARQWGRKNVLWSLAGSSGHKVWPHIDQIIDRIMRTYPDVHVVLVGDESCKLLEQGWGRFDEEKQDLVETVSRVHLRSGRWSIRESMAFAEVADLIIGTETGLMNAAGSMETHKVITLSHSSPEMLTKHWKNTISLQQPKGVGCSKSPCRQLHGGNNTDAWADCPKHEEGVSLCQWNIGPEQMWTAVQSVLGVPQRRAA